MLVILVFDLSLEAENFRGLYGVRRLWQPQNLVLAVSYKPQQMSKKVSKSEMVPSNFAKSWLIGYGFTQLPTRTVPTILIKEKSRKLGKGL